MRLLLILFLLPGFGCRAQSYFKEHFGGKISLIANVGSHNSSIGLGLNGFYHDYFYQFNAGTTFLIYNNALGGRKKFIESRTSAGLLVLAGKENRILDFEINNLNHQTAKDFGLGFSYMFYADSKKTTQTSGAFAIHIKELAFYHENDLFGGSGKDRFRTGQFHASYQYQFLKFEAGVQMWTGESRTAPLHADSCQHCPAGYRDLRNTSYGRTSHGIAFIGIRGNNGLNQTASARIGVDSEYVRHVFQNLLIHNLGQFIRRPTPHYPMLDSSGLPVFNKSEARSPKPYLQLGMNNGWWY